MPTCVPIKDLRNTAAFDEKVASSEGPVIVTKNGYDRFVCVKSSEFNRWEQAEARAKLLERIMIAEHERNHDQHMDAFQNLQALKEKHGL